MDLPKVRSVASDPEEPNGHRLVLLRMSKRCGPRIWLKSDYETNLL